MTLLFTFVAGFYLGALANAAVAYLIDARTPEPRNAAPVRDDSRDYDWSDTPEPIYAALLAERLLPQVEEWR